MHLYAIIIGYSNFCEMKMKLKLTLSMKMTRNEVSGHKNSISNVDKICYYYTIYDNIIIVILVIIFLEVKQLQCVINIIIILLR